MIRLVPDWKQAWKWYCVHGMSLALAVLGAWAMLPEVMQSAFTEQELKGAAIVLIALALGGRVLEQGAPSHE